MSAGPYVAARYTTDKGNIARIQIQPETQAFSLQGATAAGEINQEASVIVNGTRRQTGVIARSVRVRFTAAAPDGYDPNGVLRIPILTQAAWAAIDKDDTGTYLGSAIVVLGKTPEYVN